MLARAATSARRPGSVIFDEAEEIYPVNWASLGLGHAERFDRRIPSKCRFGTIMLRRGLHSTVRLWPRSET